MAKIKNVSVVHTVLMLFLFLTPIFGSGGENRAVVYISLCAFLLCMGYTVIRKGRIVLTKTFAVFISLSAYAYLQMIFVSDKGGQFAWASAFLLCAISTLVVGEYRRQVGCDNLIQIFKRLVFAGAAIYAVAAVLYQVFIQSSFLGSRMDFSNGSATASACFMLLGIMLLSEMIGKNKNKAWVYIAFAVMAYVFIMTKSFVGYTVAALVIFSFFMTKKHKKTEAFVSLVGVAVTAVLSIIGAIADAISNPMTINAAIKGLVSIFGVGCGGYNAANSVLDKAYDGTPAVLALMTESFGVIGVLFVAVWIAGALLQYKKTRSFTDLAVMLVFIALIFSSSASVAFALPMVCMYYAIREEDYVVCELNGALSVPFGLLAVFFLILSLAFVPYSMANQAFDMGKYEKSAELYAAGASMEMFNSKGWEAAYSASVKAFEEANTAPEREKYIDNAIKFNKKNYDYKVKKARVHTEDGDYLGALEIWEGIIARYDREYLYPMYAQRIYDVMANCPLGLEKIEELYNTMSECAKKATDASVVREVNDILAKSQQYYINVREGTVTYGDMYITEEVPEVEYESGNTEG